jgi:glutathione synthase/RimK-type ligase-like ATP-grasp enzyme
MIYLVAAGGNFSFLRTYLIPEMESKDDIRLIKGKVAKTMLLTEESIIRFGTATNAEAKKSLNSIKAICQASDKYRARKLMEGAGVSIPKTFAGTTEMAWTDLPVIVRPKKHQGGEKFFYCSSYQDIAKVRDKIATDMNGSNIYISSYINKSEEYRVHVAHGKALAVQEKYKLNHKENDQSKSWNRKNGFHFRVMKWNDVPKGLCPLATHAVEALELDFGAVDIILEDKKFYVLEINTAPRIEGYTAKRYAQYFDFIISAGFEIPHFNPDKKYMMRNEDLEFDN